MIGRPVDHAPVRGGNADDFKRASRSDDVGWSDNRREADIRKNRLLDGIVIVSTNTEADIKWFLKMDAERAAGRLQFLPGLRNGHRNIIAALFEPHFAGRRNI